MSTILIENTIHADQRFTKHEGQEFHVFSSEICDASAVEEWIAVTKPFKVLLDTETVARLKNKRLEWKFDDNKTISAVIIKDE